MGFLAYLERLINLSLTNLTFRTTMKFEVTHVEPFDLSCLGVFTVTGRNEADRENKLWDKVQVISSEPLKNIEYQKLK